MWRAALFRVTSCPCVILAFVSINSASAWVKEQHINPTLVRIVLWSVFGVQLFCSSCYGLSQTLIVYNGKKTPHEKVPSVPVWFLCSLSNHLFNLFSSILTCLSRLHKDDGGIVRKLVSLAGWGVEGTPQTTPEFWLMTLSLPSVNLLISMSLPGS